VNQGPELWLELLLRPDTEQKRKKDLSSKEELLADEMKMAKVESS